MGTKSRRNRDLSKQNSGSTTESDDEFQGTTTRRAWSDFCKGRSSQSEDDLRSEKKKKMAKTKKAALKKNPKGRIRKPKRPLKIDGLDLLHSRTLFSTSDQAIGMRLPPAAGCIDEHLASFAGTMIHEELDVSSAPTETPYAVKILLDVYRAQFMNYLESMKSSAFKENLHRQIENEKEKNKRLMNRTGQLEKQIKVLVEDSVALLKARMQELGINTTSQNDLLCKAKEIVGKHKELQIMANKIQNQVNTLEEEHKTILASHVKKLTEKQTQPIDFELASKESHKLVLKEIENTFVQRKNLKNQISSLEAEVTMIEKANEEKRHTIITPTESQQLPKNPPGIYVSGNIYKSTNSTVPAKSSRKNREHRTKTHDWPEIPEIGKIEEKNPEILAQKILETGRQIEAGKLLANPQLKSVKAENASYQKRSSNVQHPLSAHAKGESMSMQAPNIAQKAVKSSTTANVHQGLPKAVGSKKSSDSHKVVNFEDRLKSIITSALQGQDQPPSTTPQQQTAPTSSNIQQQKQQPQMTQQRSGSPKKTAAIQMTPFTNSVNWNMQSQSQQMLSIVTGPSPHHLSNITTISPTPQSTSPAKNHRQMVALPQMAPQLPIEHKKEYPPMQHQESTYAQLKRNEHLPNFAKVMNIMHQSEANKMFQRHSQQNPMMQQQQQNQYLQAQREREASMMFQQRQLIEEKREFKTPDNVRYERPDMGRSSVGSIENEYINSGSNSSSNRSQTQRSSSSLSQPDYTQVSPAKLALRRHLSQEKLSHHSSMGSQLMTKTIGEFINSEIEKTLEITPQSIINAVIQHNMPTVSRMSNESVINCSMSQDRDLSEHHHYATLKPTSSKPQRPQHVYMHEQYADHRQKMLPISSKYIPPTSAERKSAIASPTIRHDEPMNFASGSKSPDRHYQQQESSYKIDTKMFTSNIGMSMRKDEEKEKIMEHEPPLEGLAASLRQHVIASMKIKEETESSELKYPYPQVPFTQIIKKECKKEIIY